MVLSMIRKGMLTMWEKKIAGFDAEGKGKGQNAQLGRMIK